MLGILRFIEVKFEPKMNEIDCSGNFFSIMFCIDLFSLKAGKLQSIENYFRGIFSLRYINKENITRKSIPLKNKPHSEKFNSEQFGSISTIKYFLLI